MVYLEAAIQVVLISSKAAGSLSAVLVEVGLFSSILLILLYIV